MGDCKEDILETDCVQSTKTKIQCLPLPTAQAQSTLWNRCISLHNVMYNSTVVHSVSIENAPPLLLSVDLWEMYYASNVCRLSTGSTGYTEVN